MKKATTHNVRKHLRLQPADGRLRALLHENTHVLQLQDLENGGCEMEVELTVANFQRLLKKEPALAEKLLEY